VQAPTTSCAGLISALKGWKKFNEIFPILDLIRTVAWLCLGCHAAGSSNDLKGGSKRDLLMKSIGR
jgi:hypothetical protein